MRRQFPPTRRDDFAVTALAETPQPRSPRRARRGLLIRIGTSLLVVAVVVSFLAGVATGHLIPGPITPIVPARGGSIVAGINFEPDSLLPWGGSQNPNLEQALWAPLWYGDPQGLFHPGIVTELPSLDNGGISADYTTWTIHLRSGLKWSDGTPLTAEDCAFTFALHANPALTLGFPSTDPADPIGFVGATALDSTTLVVRFRHRFVRLLFYLVDGGSSILPKEVFGRLTATEFAKSPEHFWPTVTSGPFMIKERVGHDHITVVRNPYYYQGPDKPYLDRITFTFVFTRILSPSDVLSKVQTHAVDTIEGLDSTLMKSYRAIPGYTTYLDAYPSNYEVLAFNLTDPLMSDHAIRQALTMSINRSKIITTILNGAATTTCDDSVGTFAHEPNVTCYPFDPTGAGKLLDEDGWTMGTDGYRHKNGQNLELAYATTTRADRAATQALIRDELATIGIKIDLDAYTPGEYFPALYHGEFQIGEFANNNYYDPDDSGFLRSDQTPDRGGGNAMHYANPQVDQLEQDQASSVDMNARKADFQLIHADVLKDLPVMYLYAPLVIYCARSDLHNFEPSSEGGAEAWNIWDWWLSATNR